MTIGRGGHDQGVGYTKNKQKPERKRQEQVIYQDLVQKHQPKKKSLFIKVLKTIGLIFIWTIIANYEVRNECFVF